MQRSDITSSQLAQTIQKDKDPIADSTTRLGVHYRAQLNIYLPKK